MLKNKWGYSNSMYTTNWHSIIRFQLTSPSKLYIVDFQSIFHNWWQHTDEFYSQFFLTIDVCTGKLSSKIRFCLKFILKIERFSDNRSHHLHLHLQLMPFECKEIFLYIRVGKKGSLGPWSRVIVYCSKLSFCQNDPPTLTYMIK